MKSTTPPTIRLKSYRPPDFLIETTNLEISLHPTQTRVRNRMRVRRNPAARKPATALRLDGEDLKLIEAKISRKVLAPKDCVVTESALTLRAIPDGDSVFTVDITTEINPDSNTALQGLYRSRGMYCTQCEAEGFRRITYFLDRPDVLSIYTTRIDADPSQAPVLLSNGNLTERGQLGRDGRHYAVWKDPHPKPSYLFAMVGGDLSSIASTFETMSGRNVDLRIYVEHGKEKRAGWAMDSLKRSMKWDEEKFGREYDLDCFNIVAVSDFNMGAMENKGLNIFNDRLVLASEATATDNMFTAIESVVAHEYFHNWTGNRITCRDWFQLCLKEGLTVYRDQEFSADERSRVVQRIGDVRQLKAHQFAEDAGPLAHPVRPASYIEINNFYTATVYEKGAELVRMLKTIIGEEGFYKAIDLYFNRHDGEAATVEDFIKSFEDATKTDLSQFMRWYEQAGTPELVCQLTYNKTNKTAELEVQQINPPTPTNEKTKPQHVPLRMGLLDPDGQDIPLVLNNGTAVEDGVLHITKRRQTFKFVDVPHRPRPSLLRGFSAPVNLTMGMSENDLAFLMQHDQDLYNRWQAGNVYATRILKKMVRDLSEGRKTDPAPQFIAALKTTLTDSALEQAYLAELLRLPTQSDIARELGSRVDPDLVFSAHRKLSKAIGKGLGAELEEVYQDTSSNKTFATDSASMGRRALRNASLVLLTARGKKSDVARLDHHFENATNMTDEAQALFLLASQPAKVRTAAMQRFHDKWKDDHLVIDSWFAAQAQAPQAATLKTVKGLTRHPLYDAKTPNKVRALIGNFAMQNPVQFNRPDGKGYDFVAKQIIAIDAFNPQLAARLVTAFRSWRNLEPKRRTLTQKAVKTVASARNLSRDVYEMASRILDD